LSRSNPTPYAMARPCSSGAGLIQFKGRVGGVETAKLQQARASNRPNLRQRHPVGLVVAGGPPCPLAAACRRARPWRRKGYAPQGCAPGGPPPQQGGPFGGGGGGGFLTGALTTAAGVAGSAHCSGP
jgi:hypothetical protein